MSANKTPLERAAGKLISAIQKEWGEEVGESTADVSESVMNRGHDLLKAAKDKEVSSVLIGQSVIQYLGEIWVRRHPSVKEYIARFEKELEAGGNV
jgi:hypothetical protein